MKALILMATWLLLSSWVDGPPAPTSAPARLIIYRQREFLAGSYKIKINDQQWGELPSNRYCQLEVPPGRVKIESVSYTADNQIVRLDARPGRTYYIKGVEEVDFLTEVLLLAPVNQEQGQREVQGLRLIVPRTK